MDISTNAGGTFRAFTTNAVTDTLPTIGDSTTSPSGGAGVFNTASRSQMVFSPFGTDADNEEFLFQMVGWFQGPNSWQPFVLFAGTCVLSADIGVATGDVLATDRYADTIARTSGIAPYRIGTLVADERNVVQMDMLGAKFVQMAVDINGAGTAATSGNALVTLF